jgi:hypothetical protein
VVQRTVERSPLQKLFAGLVGAAFAAGQGGFGFYEAAFDSAALRTEAL